MPQGTQVLELQGPKRSLQNQFKVLYGWPALLDETLGGLYKQFACSVGGQIWLEKVLLIC